jgi:predicted nucleic-acid-binding Zn-ribbon protein
MKINELKKGVDRNVKVCPKCGSDRFLVDEAQVWDAYIDENRVIQCSKPEAEVQSITCAECGEEIEFSTKLKFNFD